MQIVHTITEASAQTDKLFNAAKVYSSLNRKMIAPVDAGGNAQAFALNVKVYSAGANTTTLETASNSYVTKQAVKAWHRVWSAKLKDAGISMKDLGPYGRVFKPRLNASDTSLGSGAEEGRGEWNYSDIVTIPAATDMSSTDAIERRDLADQYTISLLGSTTAEDVGDETRKYTNVGMIESWLGSRKKYAGADGGDGSEMQEDLVFDQDNPLLLARGGNVASKIMLDEVRDLQKDEPPYTESDFIGAYKQAIVNSNADLMGQCDILAPCGLVQVSTTAACTLVFTLVGIGDM